MEQRFALVDDQISDKICIPKLTLVLHIPTVNLAKVFLFVPSICFFITSVKSPKSQGSKFRFKSYIFASSKENVNFKLLSLNVRGIRSLEIRKALFIWLNKQKADIIYLQETYSLQDIENIWRTQWSGKMFFAHGSNHSCGVMTLIRKDLDFEDKSCLCDPVGRFIILNATVQGVKYVFANIYAPNKVHDQCIYFKELQDRLDGIISSPEQKVVMGGNFNVTFDSNLDCSGGSPAQKESVKVLEEICLDMDLVDVWRIRNPDIRSFTWKQTKPLIQRQLDFWLISDICQDEVEQVKIIPSIKSDHSAITLLFNGIEEQRHGLSHWKFNSNLTKDEEYLKLITDSVPVWIEEFKDVNDKRVLWDLIKYRIRQVSMRYSKEKARLRRVKILEIETSLTFYQEKCSADPSTENFEQLEILKSKYDAHFDYLSKGAIIRSRASWYEKGEKNTKYFLSLESHKKAKSCVRKVFTKNGTLSSDPKIIMNELEDFYTGLYDSEDNFPDYANLFLRHSEIPKLSPEKAATCEGKLTVEECLQSLQSFKKTNHLAMTDLL